MLTPEDYIRSRHKVMASAAALITDELGRVLLVKPTYRRDGWLLPGGGTEAGETPWQGCCREVREEIGHELDASRPQLLAACWVAPADREASLPGHPGDEMKVFDGGTLKQEDSSQLRLQAKELSEYGFFDSARAAELLNPLSSRIMLAALRARLAATGPVYLESGHHPGTVPVLDRIGVHVRPRIGRDWPWHPRTAVPDHLPVRQAWGWLITPDGRVVLVLDPHAEPRMRILMLPGGTVEDEDTGPIATLIREADEEAQAVLGEDVVPLGWLHDPAGQMYDEPGPCARLRLAAPVTRLKPTLPDPATGRTFTRLLTSPAQAAELLGWGEMDRQQAEHAMALARERWGIQPAPPGPITEVPHHGMSW